MRSNSSVSWPGVCSTCVCFCFARLYRLSASTRLKDFPFIIGRRHLKELIYEVYLYKK